MTPARLYRHHLAALAVFSALVFSGGCVSSLPYDDMPVTRAEDALPAAESVKSELNTLKGPFTSEELVALSLRHDAELALLREDLNMAKAERRAAFQIRDPELRLSYSQDKTTEEQWETVPADYVPWMDPISYMSDFVPAPGWTPVGIDGIWRTAGTSGWDYSPSEGVWRQSPDATTRWRTTDPSSRWYVNSLTGEILPADAMPSAFRNVARANTDGRVTQATLRFFPPNPYASKYRISAADSRILMARALVRAHECALSSEVRRLVEFAQYQKEDIASLDVLVLIQKQIVKILEERVEAGAAPAVDAMKASWRHLQTISDRDRVARDHARTLRDLAPLTGVAFSELDISQAKSVQPSIDPDRLDQAQVESVALKNRADLNAMVWQIQAARDSLREADTARLPWFSHIQVSVGHSVSDGRIDPTVRWTDSSGNTVFVRDPDSSGSRDKQNEWGIEAGFVLPLFSRLTHQSAPFEAEYRRSKTQFASTWRIVVSQVNSRLADVRSAARDIRKYQEESEPQLKRMKKMLADMEGRDDLAPDEILNIRSAIVETERNQSHLEYQYRTALIDLGEAVGRDLEFLVSRPPRTPSKDEQPNNETGSRLRDDLIETLSRE